MLLSADPRRDTEAPWGRDRAADAAERLCSVRERVEATTSGLGELEFLRQRQEVLVRAALELREAEAERRNEAELRSEEKLLEENILLLRKQLNCLRRRDAGLISQLQELDRQICDLRLDTETSGDQPETDSRPSSGFYELSDGASGSLSNSSNSVFSECFCSTADADGRLPLTDELASCLECDSFVGGLCDDSSSSATVRRSSSAPHPHTSDPAFSVASCDSQSKFHCDLVTRNGSDVYRYPSPLHAVAVQSPVFLQMLGHGSHSRDEGPLKTTEAGAEAETSPLSASLSSPVVSQSSSWPASSLSSSQTLSPKRLDCYIYSLLQRRALPIRTSKPRTSISTDPSKSILRHPSLCVRQVSGPSSGSTLGPLSGSEFKPSWMAGGASAEDTATSSPQRQRFMESKCDEHETQNIFPGSGNDRIQTGLKMNSSDLVQNQNSFPLCSGIQNGCSLDTHDVHTSTNSLVKKKKKGQPLHLALSTVTLPNDFRQLCNPKANSTPKDTKQPCYLPDQEMLIKSQTTTVKNGSKLLQISQTEKTERPMPERASLESSSQSQDEGGGGASHIPVQGQNIKLRTDIKMKTNRASEPSGLMLERKGDKSHHRSSSRKSRLLENGVSTHNKFSKRVAGGAPRMFSTKIKRLPPSIPEGRVLDKQTTSTLNGVRSGTSRHHHGNHHRHSGNHHGCDQIVVVAKPKHKRNDYRRLRAIMEAPYDEAFRRAHRQQRKELLSFSRAKIYHRSGGQMSSPYSYVAGSDSEYSAECASLFHSTIVDTSEDEKSNYTTNRFGDSESSEDEYVEESTTTSDTEESGEGGTDRRGRRCSKQGAPGARAVGQEMTPAQTKALVKIKATRNLKKKILRFRSGSLKLMTTV